jgi:hypothetical protein
MVQAQVRRALEEGSYPRAFKKAEAELDGLTLREGLDRVLSELDGGDLVLYDALAARWTALAQLQGRASLNGVFWIAGRLEEIIDPVRRETAGLYEVSERNPHARFRARGLEQLSAVDREVVQRRAVGDLAILDAALAREDADAAWAWMTPVTPLDRLARLAMLFAAREDTRFGALARRLIVRFTAETQPEEPRGVAELATVLDAIGSHSAEGREEARLALFRLASPAGSGNEDN